jgi:hypothetical protein
MTEVDELLARLRKLPQLRLDGEFDAALKQRGRRQLRRPVRSAPLASLAVFGTVIVYLSWAVHFTSALYP